MPLFRAVVKGVIFNQLCENTLHFDAPGLATSAELCEVLKTVWCPTVQNIQNNQFGWFMVQAQRKLEGQNFFEPPESLSFPLQRGVLSGPAHHPCLSWIFSLRKAGNSRKDRGRIYLPGVHRESEIEGVVEANAFTAANQVKGLILERFHEGGISFQGYALVIAERKAPFAYGPVEQILVRSIFGIQRRRNIRLGT